MEKISKVVPTNNKFKIDMTKERPMRSGAPSYGAPVAQSAITLKKMEEAEKAAKLQEQMMLQKVSQMEEMSPEEVKQSEIVDKVTLSFHKSAPVMPQKEIMPSTLNQDSSIDEYVQGDVEESSHGLEENPRLSLYA